MQNLLSQRVSQLQPSATLAISAKSKELKAQGVDVIGFGAGEPDFPTPDHIREAAKRSLDRGETLYTPVGGLPDLKKAIISRFQVDYGLTYEPEHILVSCGAKHSLYNIFQALLDEGDEVIIFTPYWVSYPEMVQLAGGVPAIVETNEVSGFVPTLEDLAARVTSRTKAVLLNSPSNPTGVLYPEEFLQGLAELASKHDLVVISDEIYDKLVFDGLRFVPFASLPGMKERTITVNGVSKTYAMTGLRIGYLATPLVDLVKAATNIQGQSTSNPANPSQAAAIEALTGPQDEVLRMRDGFAARRDLMLAKINQTEGLSAVCPNGAFYVFVNTRALYGKHGVDNSSDFAAYLLEHHHVACVPGGPFGSEDHVRLSFATSDANITKGMERLQRASKELL
jgi:aspartate aminotransferase